MPFRQVGSIRYYTFENLANAKVIHGVFTRQGGVSPSPWASLNTGSLAGDDPIRVSKNRQLIFNALGRQSESIYDVWQVHSSEIVCAEEPRPPAEAHKKADAILTDKPQVTLFMRFADCVPVLLYDPVRKVIGLVHAGWQGTVKGIVGKAIETMTSVYGSQPSEILAGIGPSIGPHHYPVGPEVVAQVRQVFAEKADNVLHSNEEKMQFDLWEANRLLLEVSGVRKIEISRICTACHTEDWFSHRGENGQTGRFGVLMGLPNN